MADTGRVRVAAPTEQRNSATGHLDTLDTMGVLQLINAEDAKVPGAVSAALPQLARAVDLAVESLRAGGQVHYFGAGSSGRYGILDAAEIPPTYGYPAGRFVAHLAGGADALVRAVENVEDDEAAGRADAADVTAGDVAIGLTASGRTPYVAGALRSARANGAATVLVSSNPAALLRPQADVHIAVATGPEVVTGSTRMKAGTAQKMVLHSFSTAVMVRLGRTYSNLMIDVAPSNAKLRARQVAILQMATGADEETCVSMLGSAAGDLRVALVSLLAVVDPAVARTWLAAAGGNIRAAAGPPDRIRTGVRGTGDLEPMSGEPTAGEPMADLVMGFDVGGTGVRGVLAQLTPEGPRPSARATRRTPLRTGTQGIDGAATATVVSAIAAELLAQHDIHGIGAAPVVAVVVGCAGAVTLGEDLRAYLPRAVAQATGTRMVLICSDMLTSFLGALGGEAGVVLAVGTGAVALGSDLTGRWHRADGWGHLLGDLGGGAWIGRAGLVAALRAYDGRPGGSAALLAELRLRFTDPPSLIADLHRSDDRAAALASFAPVVLAAARAGDPAAVRIRDKACQYLAESGMAARPQPPDGGSPVTTLAITGTLLDAHHGLRAGLLARLTPDIEVRPAAGTACDGALHLAAAAIAGQLPAGTTELTTIHHPAPSS